jgi:hypothetical protein
MHNPSSVDEVKVIAKPRAGFSSKDRRSTLGLVKLRSDNRDICVGWSRVVENASSKKHQEMIDMLEKNINECLEQPIEVLEEKLFHLCYVYHSELNGLPPSPDIIELFHMVNVVQEECSRSTFCTQALQELGKTCEDYLKYYDFICKFLKLVNDLCLIYGIVNLYDYQFRFDCRVEKLKALNLSSLFSDIINMEVIWLSFAVLRPHLKHVLSKELISLAKLLQEEFFKTFEMFMESNREYLENKNVIQAWLASKNLRLVEEYGFRLDSAKVKPKYQSLTQKFFSCFMCKKGYQASELKNQLAEFEKIYHHFESILLKSWYELEKCNN